METACLRIRFTPLLKNIQKDDSKHFLEIVPEINCIQNLDKIEWRKEKNAIEYTIPMTYKIILKKKVIAKQNNEAVNALDKTYHSCVDLLLPSSDTTLLKLGSGDVNRIVSDTFVLTKVTTDVDRCNILLKEINNIHKADDSIELTTAQVQTEVHSYPSITSNLVYNELIDQCKPRVTAETQTSAEVIQSESLMQVSDVDIFDCIRRSIDKITNTELFASLPNNDSLAVEKVTHVLSINNKTESPCKLSVTPICSINTTDEESGLASRGINTIVFRLYESPNQFGSGEIWNKKVISNELCCNAHKEKWNSHTTSLQQYDVIGDHRILPEIRVANFKKIMEREILPLKIMLGNIKNKCSSLGLNWVKTQSNSNSDNSVTKSIKTKKESNRVVYSFVVDG